MGPERFLSLSYFEAVLHGKHKKTTLSAEIKNCFSYFQENSINKLDNFSVSLIHGNGITLKKVPEGKGYSVEIDGVVKTLGVDILSKQEQTEIVRKIRHITFAYEDYVRSKNRA